MFFIKTNKEPLSFSVNAKLYVKHHVKYLKHRKIPTIREYLTVIMKKAHLDHLTTTLMV